MTRICVSYTGTECAQYQEYNYIVTIKILINYNKARYIYVNKTI